MIWVWGNWVSDSFVVQLGPCKKSIILVWAQNLNDTLKVANENYGTTKEEEEKEKVLIVKSNTNGEKDTDECENINEKISDSNIWA